MTTGLGSLWSALIPLALVVALSPITVIPAVLVLQAAHPRSTGLTFLIGWLLGLAALTAAFVAGSGLLGGLNRTPPTWASWLRIAVGAALIGFGFYRWTTRHGHREMPGWMRSFTSMTPLRAGLTAAALAVVRPEVLFMCGAAGLAIGSAGLGTADSWQAATFFVAVAASSVAIPILGYLAASKRLTPTLNRVKDWMEQQHGALFAAVLILIGAMVTYNGIHAL
ncbi:GAP family protein [[Mycobacterium] nativiensis]|uniref:GAP family protein n=1 Tax=[Mycobacterium] nativiensis TaxID=2855503 RepID=A0ABU5XT44_9MYCO|nr:GAP family protein [Mycolicibacter sp. MYC340]MEB3031154.1 GAP family protein [Mycolicibacter sp. MYC340]